MQCVAEVCAISEKSGVTLPLHPKPCIVSTLLCKVISKLPAPRNLWKHGVKSIPADLEDFGYRLGWKGIFCGAQKNRIVEVEDGRKKYQNEAVKRPHRAGTWRSTQEHDAS